MNFIMQQRGLLVLTAAALVLAGVVYVRGLFLLQDTLPPGRPAEFTALDGVGGVPALLKTIAPASPISVLLFGLLILLLAQAGMASAGVPARRLTGLAALFCVPLLLNALASPVRGALLALWCGLLLWSAGGTAGRKASLAAGLLAGILAGTHIFFVLTLVWLAMRQPARQRWWFLGAGLVAALLAALLLPAVSVGLRADTADLLQGAAADPEQAHDWQRQVWRLHAVAPEAGQAQALRLWWRAMPAEPLAWLARRGENALRLFAPAEGDDTYPWTVVRTFDWQLRLLPAWSFFLVLGAFGWRAVTAEQRWQLLPYLLTPLLAAVLFGATLWWRALLAVPLCFLAARGMQALWAHPARIAACGLALVLTVFVHWLPPDYTSESLWRGMALVALHQPDPDRALACAQAWATRYPDNDEAWWLAHYAAFQAGEGALAQQYLMRAMLYAPHEYRRADYAAGSSQLRDAVVKRAPQRRDG